MLLQANTRRAGRDIHQLAAAVAVILSLLVSVLTLSSASSIQSAQADNSSRPWILDGQPIGAHEFPFLVSIWEEQRDGPKHRCTGSIIDNKHILTSAKCIEQTANELTAKLGCTHLTRCRQEIDIARVLVHPYYYLSKLKHRDQFDLALLLTLEQIEFSQEDGIGPIEVDAGRMNPKCKRSFVLAGFGRNASSGRDTMLKFRAAVVHPNECARNNTVGKGTICVHTTTGYLPQQFIGSALVARPSRGGENCENQSSQLIGVVSTTGENLTSTVTDLRTTLKDLMRLAGGFISNRSGWQSGMGRETNKDDGRSRQVENEEENFDSSKGPSEGAYIKRPGSFGDNKDFNKVIYRAKQLLDSLKKLADASKGIGSGGKGKGNMDLYLKTWQSINWSKLLSGRAR